MTNSTHRWAPTAVAMLVALSLAGWATEAAAQTKGKSVQTEAKWLGFNAEDNTVKVKVNKIKITGVNPTAFIYNFRGKK